MEISLILGFMLIYYLVSELVVGNPVYQANRKRKKSTQSTKHYALQNLSKS